MQILSKNAFLSVITKSVADEGLFDAVRIFKVQILVLIFLQLDLAV
jgi:hypothetical protein